MELFSLNFQSHCIETSRDGFQRREPSCTNTHGATTTLHSAGSRASQSRACSSVTLPTWPACSAVILRHGHCDVEQIEFAGDAHHHTARMVALHFCPAYLGGFAVELGAQDFDGFIHDESTIS
jgi:hypothetical protein